jgi:hypothetical protein
VSSIFRPYLRLLRSNFNYRVLLVSNIVAGLGDWCARGPLRRPRVPRLLRRAGPCACG